MSSELPREKCDLCGESWIEHHVEPKPVTALVAENSQLIPKVVQTHMLIECPRNFGLELRDGRVVRRPPADGLLEALRFPRGR